MLQRKLLLLLGSLVALLLVAAFSAILLLNDVLVDLNRISASALERTARTTTIGSTLTSVESEFNDLRLGRTRHLDHLIDSVERLRSEVADLGALPVSTPQARAELARVRTAMPDFVLHVGELATTPDPVLFNQQVDRALAASKILRDSISGLNRALQAQTDTAQQRVTARFRWTVLGLGLAFLVMINASILVLMRAATMILRPVEKLVDASRRLAREEFDHRVQIDQRDEFGELARAYNRLAEQLRLNEQRKIETLHQVARTLSHELNNAISIIDLQLEMMARREPAAPLRRDRLQQIHATLMRMSGIVDDLKRVRRIVLTDYVGGVKMLDLQRSVEDGPPEVTTFARTRTEPTPS